MESATQETSYITQLPEYKFTREMFTYEIASWEKLRP
jgi:hypothetical protein